MAREYPVIRICPKLTDRARRCTYKAYIIVFDRSQKEELVVTIKWDHLVIKVWIVQFFSLNQGSLNGFELIPGVHQGIGHIFHVH